MYVRKNTTDLPSIINTRCKWTHVSKVSIGSSAKSCRNVIVIDKMTTPQSIFEKKAYFVQNKKFSVLKKYSCKLFEPFLLLILLTEYFSSKIAAFQKGTLNESNEAERLVDYISRNCQVATFWIPNYIRICIRMYSFFINKLFRIT